MSSDKRAPMPAFCDSLLDRMHKLADVPKVRCSPVAIPQLVLPALLSPLLLPANPCLIQVPLQSAD